MMRFSRALGVLLSALVLLILGTTSGLAAPPDDPAVPPSGPLVGGTDPNAPDPGPKADSPPSDLKSYPKRDDKPGRKPAEQPKGEHKDVISVKKNSDGTIASVTIYDPAPGVTPEELATKLRAQGEPNVQVGSLAEASSGDLSLAYDPYACAYGTARTNGCPPSYWSNNGYADPQVRFNDHSSYLWPVDAAVYTWNQTVGIDSYYRWNSCPFQAGARCVDVWSGNYGNNGWQGLTQLSYVPGTTYRIAEQGNAVYFNEYYTPANYRNTACHELGHALGLAHNISTSSCLYFQSNNSPYPLGDDHNMLTSVYSIYRAP